MSLFKKVINTIIGEETEDQKVARLEREKVIQNQVNIIENMKCPICGNMEFNRGYINISGSYGGRLASVSSYHKDYSKHHNPKVVVCSICGNVQIFADFKTTQTDYNKF